MVQVTEQQFGIVSDFLGDREDMATVKLPEVYLPESSGVFLQYGLVRSMPGANAGAFLTAAGGAKKQTTDGFAAIHHHRHTSAAGVEYVFVFTKAHIYMWEESTHSYTTKFTCGSNCDLWDSASIDGKVVATNGVDYVQVWDETTPGTAFAALGTVTGLDLDGASSRLTKAKYLITHEGYLILGATTEDGTYYPMRQRWSAGNDITDFNMNGTGDCGVKDFAEGSDAIKGFGRYTANGARILVVFKEKSMYAQVLVEDLGTWDWPPIGAKIGLLATHSVINDAEGNLYYIASDFTARKFRGGVISQAKAKTLRAMNRSLVDLIEADYWQQYNQVVWSIPDTPSATVTDLLIAFNIEYDIWHEYPFSVRSFGKWTQQAAYTIDQLDLLSGSIDGLDAFLPSIDYVEGAVGFDLDLVSDHSGYTYVGHSSETDMGGAVTRSLVISVDLAQRRALHLFKRASQTKLYFAGRSTAGTLAVAVKKDNEPSFTQVGTVGLYSLSEITDADLPIDERAKHFLFKISATVLFDFLGMFWTYEFDGED